VTAELLALAEATARAAGAQLREAFARGGHEISSKSTPTDLVSEADRAAEQLIRDRLLAARPGDAILGEEGGSAAGSSGVRWVVDPLDGTVNFLFGIPQWAVSIAAEDETGVVCGVVYDPILDELWSAERDGPARLDGAEITGSRQTDLGQAMVATGFGYSAQARAAQGAVVARLLPQVRDIRRIGAAALDLAWAAGGRYDAFYERGLNPWDCAAGALLCERAGLVVEDLAADGEAGAGILVAAPALVEPLRRLIAAPTG
jgi:myo-inositol-1(or 4)-monophosphatase